MTAPDTTSTRPYLIRALYEWCTDNGFTPYVAVAVDDSVQVPREFVNNNEIVLNIGFDATTSLTLGNEFIEFKARFGGVAREILVPISHVMAIYARENGQGMAFPPPVDLLSGVDVPATALPPAVLHEAGGTDARSSAETDRIVQLVTTDSAMESDGDDAPRPPPVPSGGSKRPALKRVK